MRDLSLIAALLCLDKNALEACVTMQGWKAYEKVAASSLDEEQLSDKVNMCLGGACD